MHTYGERGLERMTAFLPDSEGRSARQTAELPPDSLPLQRVVRLPDRKLRNRAASKSSALTRCHENQQAGHFRWNQKYEQKTYAELCGDSSISLSQRAPRELPYDFVDVDRKTRKANLSVSKTFSLTEVKARWKTSESSHKDVKKLLQNLSTSFLATAFVSYEQLLK